MANRSTEKKIKKCLGCWRNPDCNELVNRKAKRCPRCAQGNRYENADRPPVVVDERHAEEVGRHCWVWARDRAYGKIGGKTVYLHQFVFQLEYGYLPELIDHIDRNPLNNRIENLRPANKSLNARNNGRVGMAARKTLGGRFVATIKRHGKERYLGSYETPEEASAVYQNAKEILIEFEAIESLRLVPVSPPLQGKR